VLTNRLSSTTQTHSRLPPSSPLPRRRRCRRDTQGKRGQKEKKMKNLSFFHRRNRHLSLLLEKPRRSCPIRAPPPRRHGRFGCEVSRSRLLVLRKGKERRRRGRGWGPSPLSCSPRPRVCFRFRPFLPPRRATRRGRRAREQEATAGRGGTHLSTPFPAFFRRPLYR
jgi:hypothetical protein